MLVLVDRVVMPDVDGAFSLLTMFSLLSGWWPGLLPRFWCFFTIEDISSFLSLRLEAVEGPCFRAMLVECYSLVAGCFRLVCYISRVSPLYISEVFT